MWSPEVLNDYPDALSEAERENHLDAIHKSPRRMSALMEEVLFSRSMRARFDLRAMRDAAQGWKWNFLSFARVQ
jgi:hypothetical protein